MAAKKAVIIVGLSIFIFGIPSGLSFGAMADLKLMGMTFFDHVDNIASNYLLPLGGMLTAIFVGWVWGTNNAHLEIEKFNAYNFCKKIKHFTHSHITPKHARAIMLTKSFQDFKFKRCMDHLW